MTRDEVVKALRIIAMAKGAVAVERSPYDRRPPDHSTIRASWQRDGFSVPITFTEQPGNITVSMISARAMEADKAIRTATSFDRADDPALAALVNPMREE